MTNWKLSRLLVVVIIFLLLNDGCKKSEITELEKQPPEIPPASTFMMDFSDFSSTKNTTGARLAPGTEMLTKKNWSWAALNVGIWSTIVTAVMLVPGAAFLESFQHQPVLQPDGSWLWMYHFYVLGIQYTAKLYGKVEVTGVKWDMYISRQNGFTDFQWYTGTCDLMVTAGTWTLNKEPNNPAPFIEIEWHRNPIIRTLDVKYTNVIPDDPENGGYIFYGVTGQNPYNAFYDIYSKSKNNLMEIEWNLTTRDGRIGDSLYFGDGNWHCWDSSLEDIDCP